MYQPSVFNEDRLDVMHDLIAAHPFATLIATAGGTITADHLPLVLRRSAGPFGELHGHLSAANPLVRSAKGPLPVLVVFQGPQSYVSPSWYPSKAEHQKVVPTWNYVVVHARGHLRFTRDTGWLLAHLEELSATHESHRKTPWQVTDAPQDFIARQLRGIAGFEIAIEELTGTWKVSQNRPPPDRDGVAEGLREEASANGQAISKLVAERSAARRQP